MKPSSKSRPSLEPASVQVRLSDLRIGEHGILGDIDLPEGDARRIMELGFIPGARVVVGRSAPGGDPRVYQIGGAEVALRRETAKYLQVRRVGSKKGGP